MLKGDCDFCFFQRFDKHCEHFDQDVSDDLKQLCLEQHLSKVQLDALRDEWVGNKRAGEIIETLCQKLSIFSPNNLFEGILAIIVANKDQKVQMQQCLKERDTVITQLNTMIDTAAKSGEWQSDRHTRGYYNGLIFALSMLKGEPSTEDFFPIGTIAAEEIVDKPGLPAEIAPAEYTTTSVGDEHSQIVIHIHGGEIQINKG